MSAGGWKGETPAPENQLIINYLDAVRPVPSDEQYLPAFCDIAKLLQQLAELGEGLTEVARRIARVVLDFDVVNRNSKSVKEALEKLEVFVERSSKVEGVREGGSEEREEAADGEEMGGGGDECDGGVEGTGERESAKVDGGGLEGGEEGERAKVDGGGDEETGGSVEEGEEGGAEVAGGEENGCKGAPILLKAGGEEQPESEAIRSGEAEENGDERGG